MRTLRAGLVAVAVSAVGVLLFVPAGGASTGTRPLAAARGRVVLGAKAFAPNGTGWGSSRPSTIFNGGDPSGLVTHIHWSSWGGSTARGHGLNAIFKPHGGYYRQLATIELRASSLGHCSAGGPRAYRHLDIRVPARPGGPLGPWTAWAGAQSICRLP